MTAFHPCPSVAQFSTMSVAISVHNVSKLYRLGEISRGQLLADLHRWWMKRRAPKAAETNPQAVEQPRGARRFLGAEGHLLRYQARREPGNHWCKRRRKVHVAEDYFPHYGPDDWICENPRAVSAVCWKSERDFTRILPDATTSFSTAPFSA